MAQGTGKIAGRVLDEMGNPLSGAVIVVEGNKQGAGSDMDGYYAIINVRAGEYRVSCRYVGYKTQSVSGVRVSSDQTRTLNFQLTSSTIMNDEVIVVAKKPLLEFNQTSSVSSINKDEIKNLPVQSLSDIVNLQAGVVDGHFRGGRIGEVQYQVDGVTVNNPYDNSSSITLDRSILEEVQVISGTFDAKYGQAMSGVVNAVLKSGSKEFEYSGEFYSGTYFTTDNRYPGNEKLQPLNIQSYQFTVSGPAVFENTTFFVSGRKFGNKGYMKGTRRFMPTDKHDYENKVLYPNGDNAEVSLGTVDESSAQFKVANQSVDGLQVSYQATLFDQKRTPYLHNYRFNPEGIKTNKTVSVTHGLGITHTLSDKMFYRLNLRENYFDYIDARYESVFDPRYLSAGTPLSDDSYENGAIMEGVDLGRFKQKTNSFVAKLEYTWQATRNDFIEAGFEYQKSYIEFGSPGLLVETNVNGVQILQPRTERVKTSANQNLALINQYIPDQLAVYLQDRIEYGDMVVRAGVRYEMFNANAKIPGDLQNPANSIAGAQAVPPKRTSTKMALAPRIGLNFPVTVSSSVHVSYGHFYQLPGLSLLYDNADYAILDQLQAGGISYGVMGNPDLKPEKTIQYEFGFKQGFGDVLGADISFFYKDIRDLLGVEFVSTYSAADYARFTNVDFGSVYGFTISLSEKSIGNLSSSVDYTLQYAQGNSSDAKETANRAAGGKDPRPRNIPFNWDQRNTLNCTFIYSEPGDYSISTIIKLGSGQPYTPEIGSGFNAALETNSGQKKGYVLVDLRAEKSVDIGVLELNVFARVFNLLNTNFVNGFVFANTGSPDYSLTPNSDRARLIDPSRFQEPRRIEFGISFRSK
ncbi:MAG: TonB-dependent receptor [Ignavibacteriales bacterium]|nr:TonB-dependent receptor [Ignavibacteriales bacterium]